ncbi:hypothetical protein B0H11DRAFT_2043389 [Mycena galericulata]|nr:hypothetical protein B0H11DRAFT_2043389 [Mycena galericulata]
MRYLLLCRPRSLSLEIFVLSSPARWQFPLSQQCTITYGAAHQPTLTWRNCYASWSHTQWTPIDSDLPSDAKVFHRKQLGIYEYPQSWKMGTH